MSRSGGRPSLWHIPVSHYSEKARWALDWKGVGYDLHAPPPGPHMAIAHWLSRGRSRTFPLLILDGEASGDSTAVIAALEQRYPEPALYPADAEERDRALALEEFFDEELGPYARHLAFHHLRQDPELIGEFAARQMPGPLRRYAPMRRVGGQGRQGFLGECVTGVGADDDADEARAKILAGARSAGGRARCGRAASTSSATRSRSPTCPRRLALRAVRGPAGRPIGCPSIGGALRGVPRLAAGATGLPVGRAHVRQVPSPGRQPPRGSRRSPAAGARLALDRPGDLSGHPAAVEATGLRQDDFAVEPAADESRIERDVPPERSERRSVGSR